MLSDVAVYVRSGAYRRLGQIDEVLSLATVERHLGLGTWVLSVRPTGDAVDQLVRTPGAGIEVRDGYGGLIFAGSRRKIRREATARDHVVTVSGWDDMAVLQQRVAHPEPGTAAPPFSLAAHNTHSGPASSVIRQFIDRNAGPAALPDRRTPLLTLAPDPAEGPTITASARWVTPLLAHVADLAGPRDMCVTVRQVDGGLVVTVRAARDRTNIELSPRAGTLESWTSEESAPEMTAGWVGGQGDLTARAVVQAELAPPDAWPGRFERFLDHSAAKAEDLDRILADELAASAAKTSLELVPTQALGARLGEDFDLGDRVSVVIGGVRFSEQVTSSSLRVEDGRATRSFTVGGEQMAGPAALFAQARRFGVRLRGLEGT